MSHPLPDRELSELLFRWTQGARNRLYRLAGLAGRSRILDLGAGWGFVGEELAARTAAEIVCLDRLPDPLNLARQRSGGRLHVCVADAHALPFPDTHFDLVITHFSFLWFAHPDVVVGEVCRVLTSGGCFLGIEPDYGGLMEAPDLGWRHAWRARLAEAGAHPEIGRQLPGHFRRAGLDVQVLFCDRYQAPDPRAADFLAGLPPASRPSSATVPETLFLPLWLLHAVKRPSGIPSG